MVGGGKWGLNHIKTLNSLNIYSGCVEINAYRREKLKSYFPELVFYSSIDDALKINYDGFIISTPSETHFDLAKKIISSNKPVLVEKPLSLSLNESRELKTLLIKNDGKLVVGHLMLFHPAIIKMKSIIDQDQLGKIRYIYSNRLNLGTVRNNENVLWSFAPHDFSILQLFINSFPSQVTSLGQKILNKNIHDTVITYLKYPNNVEGHVFTSWINPFKEHKIVVVGSEGSLIFEDSASDKPLLFSKTIITKNDNLFSIRNHRKEKIKYDKSSALENELKYFINVINGSQNNRSNIDLGIDVVKILDLATKNLTSNSN